ncbi:MAG: hypothetical protein K2X03_20485 [Bryobacteraceae bacterium]|nr:hypothetical protein [Bryobacteraceae bacterium]
MPTVCRPTRTFRMTAISLFGLLAISAASAQTSLDWRKLGSTGVDLGLPALATGAVTKVAYADGANARLNIETRDGRQFASSDGEKWRLAETALNQTSKRWRTEANPPESGARAVESLTNRARLYAFASHAWRSDDGGASWRNLTAIKGQSLLGSAILDLAVSPTDADEIVAATETGLWRSLDGGITWDGLNQNLPNLSVRRIHRLPEGVNGLEVEVTGIAGTLVWQPGEKAAFRPGGRSAEAAAELRTRLTAMVGAPVTAAGSTGDFLYAGSADGRLFSSADNGRTWRAAPQNAGGPVTSFAVDPNEPSTVIATVAADRNSRVWRTINGGVNWDDISADLPAGRAYGVAFDLATSSVYVATANGVYWTRGDLRARGPATPWERLAGNLPAAPVYDVQLNRSSTQLYVALDGYGLYAANAPHRRTDPRFVSAADYATRSAAPGSLLSFVGGPILQARTGDRVVPILASSPDEAQVQVPFEAQGDALPLSIDRLNLRLPLEPTAPAIFIDRDGTPMMIDADSGLLLDAANPARPRMRVQVLATGLGRVTPDWPTGVPAPLDNAPRVAATVKVYLDRVPVTVTKATLAPGYVGFYVIEFELPSLVNAGPAEIYVEAAGRPSNRTRLMIRP